MTKSALADCQVEGFLSPAKARVQAQSKTVKTGAAPYEPAPRGNGEWLTDEKPRTPVTVIRVRSHDEEDDQLDGKQDTVEVEDH